MLYGTCKETLEMHKYPPTYALLCKTPQKKTDKNQLFL